MDAVSKKSEDAWLSILAVFIDWCGDFGLDLAPYQERILSSATNDYKTIEARAERAKQLANDVVKVVNNYRGRARIPRKSYANNADELEDNAADMRETPYKPASVLLGATLIIEGAQHMLDIVRPSYQEDMRADLERLARDFIEDVTK